MKKFQLIISCLTLILVSCGPKKTTMIPNGNEIVVYPKNEITSTFYDAPVKGLSLGIRSELGVYRYDKTDATGSFKCYPGEIVSFYLSNTFLGDGQPNPKNGVKLGQAACADKIFISQLNDNEENVNTLAALLLKLNVSADNKIIDLGTIDNVEYSSDLNYEIDSQSGFNYDSANNILQILRPDISPMETEDDWLRQKTLASSHVKSVELEASDTSDDTTKGDIRLKTLLDKIITSYGGGLSFSGSNSVNLSSTSENNFSCGYDLAGVSLLIQKVSRTEEGRVLSDYYVSGKLQTGVSSNIEVVHKTKITSKMVSSIIDMKYGSTNWLGTFTMVPKSDYKGISGRFTFTRTSGADTKLCDFAVDF